MTTARSQFQLKIGSRFENIDLVQVTLDDALREMGLDEDARHWIDLAVREAVANAIKHGNGQDADKQVRVTCELQDGHLVIEVHDEGEGFDASQLQDPLSPENLLRPNGRGIFYMRNFMDAIDFGTSPKGGTIVTLRKNLEGLTDSESESDDAT